MSLNKQTGSAARFCTRQISVYCMSCLTHWNLMKVK